MSLSTFGFLSVLTFIAFIQRGIFQFCKSPVDCSIRSYCLKNRCNRMILDVIPLVDGAQNESCGGFDKNLAEPAHPGHPPSTHNTIDIRLFISEQIIALVLCKET